MELIEATPQQSSALQANVRELQRYWETSVLPVVAARYAWWSVLRAAARRYNVDPADVVGPQAAELNAQLDRAAIASARLVAALSAQQATVQPWTPADWSREGRPPVYFGVVESGRGLDGLGAWWLAIPTILKITVGAIAAAGTWLLADAWLQGEQIEAEAARAHAITQQKYADAIQRAAAIDPAIAAQLANTLQQANALAANPGDALDRLGRAAADLAEGIGTAAKGAGSMWPLLAAFFLLRGSK